MKKVYCYIEVPDECENRKDAWAFWLNQTRSRIKLGLHPNIELYQIEEAKD